MAKIDLGYIVTLDNVFMADPNEVKNLIPFVREIDSDNSCLFNSIGYLVDRENFNHKTSKKLRKIVSDTIKSNKEKYCDAFLNNSNEKYAKKILEPDVWGGAIEAQILAEHFKVEIVSFNVIDKTTIVYGEGQDYNSRIYIAYNGAHYNALVMIVDYECYPELDACKFLPEDEVTMTKFQKLVQDLHQSYKEIMKIRKQQNVYACQTCFNLFKGKDKAQGHSDMFGHTDFKIIQ